MDDVVAHIAKFVSGIWQIHPFGEGNTRTTTVFTIKYLRSIGFDVNNDLFADKSWFFRNALVRANYRNVRKGVEPDMSFLILFLLLKSALLLATEDVIYNLKFKQLSAPYFLPTNEVQKVYQDKDGFIWFATRNGLCQYNGYETTLYKSNLYSPDLLTTNSLSLIHI